jgi:hypothetical protein
MVSKEVEEIAEEAIEENGQSNEVKQQLLNFYENTINNNLGGNDLQGLINTIELTEKEKLDGS